MLDKWLIVHLLQRWCWNQQRGSMQRSFLADCAPQHCLFFLISSLLLFHSSPKAGLYQHSFDIQMNLFPLPLFSSRMKAPALCQLPSGAPGPCQCKGASFSLTPSHRSTPLCLWVTAWPFSVRNPPALQQYPQQHMGKVWCGGGARHDNINAVYLLGR